MAEWKQFHHLFCLSSPPLQQQVAGLPAPIINARPAEELKLARVARLFSISFNLVKRASEQASERAS